MFYVLTNVVLTGKRPTPKSTFTVSFDPNGGSDMVSQKVEKGSTVAKPADPTRKGDDFKGWYTDPDFKNPYDFSTPVSSDLKLYAKWQEQPVTAVLYSDGLLSIQKGTDTDASHGTVLGTWTGFEGSRAPWYGQRSHVRKVHGRRACRGRGGVFRPGGIALKGGRPEGHKAGVVYPVDVSRPPFPMRP